MVVAVTNAYSRANAGDGLLVDLSMRVLMEAGLSSSEMSLIAVDPASFEGIPTVGAPGCASLNKPQRLTEITASLLHQPNRRYRELLGQARLQVAVGGGYLRFGSAREALVTSAVHLSQIRQGVSSGVPTILLPQSIGPLAFRPRSFFRVLGGAAAVCVRDDRSLADLGSLSNVHRFPDLAVQQVGFVAPAQPGGSGRIGLVVRALPRFRDYPSKLRRLLQILGTRVVPLLQSETGRRNRDSLFMRQLGITAWGSLSDALRCGVVDTVVSVRMHGSLQAVLGGLPSVHLSYERKGFSAFQDLGLTDWVHHAGHFDPDLVATQALTLTESQEAYWASLEMKAAALRDSRAELIALIRKTIV